MIKKIILTMGLLFPACFALEANAACDLNEYKLKVFTIAFGMQNSAIIARDQWDYIFEQLNQAENYINQSKMDEACKILDDLIAKHHLQELK